MSENKATNKDSEQRHKMMEMVKEFHPDLSGDELEKHFQLMKEQFGDGFWGHHEHHNGHEGHFHDENTPMHGSYANFLLRTDRSTKQPPEELVKRLNVQPDYTILELGPGPGYYSIALAKSVPRGKLILVDRQQGMLNLAKERLEENGITNVEFINTDARSIPLQNGTVDVASLALVLGELPEPEKCLKELHRIIKLGGLLSVTEDKLVDPDYLSPKKLERLVPKELFAEEQRFDSKSDHTINFRSIPVINKSGL